MLRSLSEYLNGALPQMRESGSTLGRELALARAYLNVLQARMGERLEVCIAVPEELNSAQLPPMMLSTLVENAVKHGIAPLPQGGMIKIDAAREGDRLTVRVADNGVGFHGLSGSGIGLANTRARLSAIYADEGSLTFAPNPVHGVTVSISLPYLGPLAHGVAL
jgi:LytS/YehU family sensor histidine kinase